MVLGSGDVHVGSIGDLSLSPSGLRRRTLSTKPFMSAGTKQVMAIVVGGIAGVMALTAALRWRFARHDAIRAFKPAALL